MRITDRDRDRAPVGLLPDAVALVFAAPAVRHRRIRRQRREHRGIPGHLILEQEPLRLVVDRPDVDVGGVEHLLAGMRACREQVEVELSHELGCPVRHLPDAGPELLERAVDAHAELERVPVDADRNVELAAQGAGKGPQLVLVHEPLQLIDNHDLPVGAEGPGIEQVHGDCLLTTGSRVTSNGWSICPCGNSTAA